MPANLASHRVGLNALLRSAARLNADMPLVLMTDDRKADWARAVRALPPGSVVVVRAREAKQRHALARQLSGLATLLIADDPRLAAQCGAAGLHLPQLRLHEAAHWRARFPHWIITASAHSLRALMGAHYLDAVFLSPVFATASHPGVPPLTPVRAAFIAAQAPVPVYALGGVTPRNAGLLAPAFSGIAAISSLL
ncbi:MAG TPA: thiamine phosphate synthase [Rhizomicrobium sp.]|nr:thiamine phosphate synthase [Rhizomicrobium sp.]